MTVVAAGEHCAKYPERRGATNNGRRTPRHICRSARRGPTLRFTMRDLRVATLGRISAGDEAGRVVEVIDDGANTGGFLIFTYADLDRSPEVFDAWVQSVVDVELYFDDRGWQIEWVDSKRT
jgi:hypothetical protein